VNWIKKNWSNILFGVLIVLLLVPQTGRPIKVFVNRLLAFSPGVESADDIETLQDYNWKLRDLQGQLIDFKTFKGKKIVVNYWATWCPPCIAEMPSMQALHDDYKDKVAFVFVTNDDEDAIRKFMAKHDYTLPIYRAESDAPRLLETNSLPTTYLINETGEILINKTGAADWNSAEVRGLLD
jgi:thiol-disulfide isomerase/thioredoxin